MLIKLMWAFSGKSGVRERRGMQSMGVSGARLTCGGLAPRARTGYRSLARVCGHGSVSLVLSPLSVISYVARRVMTDEELLVSPDWDDEG